MTELYRGLLLVLTRKLNELILSFRQHIRSFNQLTIDPTNYMDVGVTGFWNLMLEVVLTLFVLCCLVSGVVLIAALAVVCYPIQAFLRFSSLILKNTRNPHHDMLLSDIKISPTIDEEPPKIIKKTVK